VNELACDIEFLRGLDQNDRENPAVNDAKTCKRCDQVAKKAVEEKKELISLHEQQMKKSMLQRVSIISQLG
jgi:hypothetical protein